MPEDSPSDVPAVLPASPAMEAPAAPSAAFFGRADWWSFGVTTLTALTLYLATLAPDVTLGFSGIFCAGGMYAGVAHPPGYPLSTLWAWAFIHFLPFGTIAWRVAVSSAVAGALACGVIALMVSRGGVELMKKVRGDQPTDERREAPLRVTCGFAAGMVFGANGTFWQRAVIADFWTLSILVLCLVLCLLMRWVHRPERRRFLYLAAFAYGLALTNSQLQLAFASAIPFLVWAGDRRIGRDLFLAGFLLLLGGLAYLFAGKLPLICDNWSPTHPLFKLFVAAGVITTGCGAGLAILTRRLFTEWRPVLACAVLFLLGLSFYFYVPIASMTNPPMNWGYPRTVAGFYHVITRGQYEGIHPTEDLSAFAKQVRAYARVTVKEFGGPFLAVALVPLLVLRRMGRHERGWILALLAAYVSLAFLMLAVLNPSVDRSSLDIIAVLFSVSYVVLALGLGYGLTVLGARLLKPTSLSSE